jgi:hypothetical protein
MAPPEATLKIHGWLLILRTFGAGRSIGARPNQLEENSMQARNRVAGQVRGHLTLGLAVVAVALAVPATASTLGSVKSLVGCTDPIEFVQDPTSCTLDINGNLAGASVTLLPLPSVLVTAVSPVGTGNKAQANAGATYYFQVIGGNVGDIVPILIGVTLEAHSRAPDNPRGYAQASLVTFTIADGLTTGARGLHVRSSLPITLQFVFRNGTP